MRESGDGGAVASEQISGQMHAGCGVQAQIEASSVAQLSQGKTAGARLACEWKSGNEGWRQSAKSGWHMRMDRHR